MKLAVLIIVFSVLFLFMAELTITFKPFNIGFNNLKYAIGYMMLIIGALVVYDAGLSNGKQKTFDLVIESIQELKDKK